MDAPSSDAAAAKGVELIHEGKGELLMKSSLREALADPDVTEAQRRVILRLMLEEQQKGAKRGRESSLPVTKLMHIGLPQPRPAGQKFVESSTPGDEQTKPLFIGSRSAI